MCVYNNSGLHTAGRYCHVQLYKKSRRPSHVIHVRADDVTITCALKDVTYALSFTITKKTLNKKVYSESIFLFCFFF